MLGDLKSSGVFVLARYRSITLEIITSPLGIAMSRWKDIRRGPRAMAGDELHQEKLMAQNAFIMLHLRPLGLAIRARF